MTEDLTINEAVNKMIDGLISRMIDHPGERYVLNHEIHYSEKPQRPADIPASLPWEVAKAERQGGGFVWLVVSIERVIPLTDDILSAYEAAQASTDMIDYTKNCAELIMSIKRLKDLQKGEAS